jgi:hypothetical protein
VRKKHLCLLRLRRGRDLEDLPVVCSFLPLPHSEHCFPFEIALDNSSLRTLHTAIVLGFCSAEDKGAGKYLAKLTKSEQALYLCGKESCLHHSSWRRRQMEVIEESHISRMTKRQRY